MSLNKAINSGKEYRKPYYRSGRFDRTCRPNGSCPYCFNNRYHKHFKVFQAIEDELNFYFDDWGNDWTDWTDWTI